MDNATYESKVQALVDEGMIRGDAQGIVDLEEPSPDTVTIEGRTYAVDEVLDMSHQNGVTYSAILVGRRGAKVHYEAYDDGHWVAVAGWGTANPRLLAQG